MPSLARHPLLALALPAVLVATPARAELMDTTASLGPGQVSLGIEAQAGVRDALPVEVDFHEEIGLARGLDLYLRQGFGVSGSGGLYLGAGIKWTLLHASKTQSRPGVAMWLGGHLGFSGELAGADGTIVIDYPFSRVRPYIGLDSNLEFARHSPEVRIDLGLIAGLRIGVVPHVTWFVEGGLGVLGSPRPHFISTGPRMYF